MRKAIITAKVDTIFSTQLQNLGFVVDEFLDINQADLLKIIHQYEIIIFTTYTKINKELIDNATLLKIAARVGSGMENVDLEYCKSKNIICLSSPEGNANAVGEHCLAMLLALYRNINKANFELKNNIFKREENRGEELDGKTIGIIGFGNTGQAFAKKLHGFDVQILVYDKYKIIENNFIQNVSLETIQKHANIISFHVPYNTQTHYFINENFIKNCTQKPVIINTSRGAIMDTKFILQALETYKINGFCVDVFEQEPFNLEDEMYQKLIQYNKVVATPHIAGWTHQSKIKLATILMDKIENNLAK